MYLRKIIDYKRQELEHIKRRVSLKDVRLKSEDAEPARDFLGALQVPGIRVIAEVKKASPSAGIIRPDFDPVGIAQSYEDNGAAALSVLTDEHFFQGKLAFIDQIKKHVRLPLLRKDFTFDEYQVFEARGAGADAILLIVHILTDSQLKDYRDLAEELGMVALVEVHEEEEMNRAEKTGARLVGINNRDLDTLKVDLETSVRLSKKAPQGSFLVAESGISAPVHIQKLTQAGFRVFLIGESLLRSPDPGTKLREMLSNVKD